MSIYSPTKKELDKLFPGLQKMEMDIPEDAVNSHGVSEGELNPSWKGGITSDWNLYMKKRQRLYYDTPEGKVSQKNASARYNAKLKEETGFTYDQSPKRKDIIKKRRDKERSERQDWIRGPYKKKAKRDLTKF
tara:strand:- start:396 stop:794 length:399 start_codon:yes stop_codon:yes gene_type:complete